MTDGLDLGEIPKSSQMELMSKDELIQRNFILQFEVSELIKENYELRSLKITDSQLQLILNEQLSSLKGELFGASSERYKKPIKKEAPKVPAKPKVKKPSERYPHIPVREQLIESSPIPNCTLCGETMTDSGMTEDSEQLTVIPKKFEILLQKRVKYRCKCQGCIVTAPSPARIVEGSAYSDEMIQDVALSKYCDLIPMHRYSAMAARGGLVDLPANSLIATTHQFADFLTPGYELLKQDVMNARVLSADETPHKMLEGSEKKSWYLWGFSTPESCFLECHGTRSGDVASEILLNSKCEILISDVYSGYGKAIRIVNELRSEKNQRLITNANCNAHARRYFFKAWPDYQESEFYLDKYHEIYRLESEADGKPPPQGLDLREQMRPFFIEMKVRALEELMKYPDKSQYGKALKYFLQNYSGLTLYLTDPQIPIDNNSQERLLRSHVVGRKTWYGTHSERGAKTAAVLFSIVETCKLNDVNPREYFAALTRDLLAGKPAYTPKAFKVSLGS